MDPQRPHNNRNPHFAKSLVGDSRQIFIFISL